MVPEEEDPKPSHEIGRNEWVRRVRAEAGERSLASSESKVGDVLVFIHGYNNTPKDVRERHLRLRAGLAEAGYQGTLVSFDWPSGNSALSYLEDRMAARQTAYALVGDCIALFARLQSEQCWINVHLLAHSMGAYVVREAFDDADDRGAIATANWTVSQIALASGDISSNSLSAGDSATASIYRHCLQLTNYSNPHDYVLEVSNVKRAGVAPRVGREGLPADHPAKALNVDCGAHYEALGDPPPDFVGTFCHSWYFYDPIFTQDLVHTLHGQLDPEHFPTRDRSPEGVLSLK
jgi:esterase/lipase superfamily enzyme